MHPHKCPHCGTDVMATGFTVEKLTAVSYMRFQDGVKRIAASEQEMDNGHPRCLQCMHRLPFTAKELLAA
jgi:hypothetical protein